MARSNRQLTQFAVHRLSCILRHGTGSLPKSDSAGNTEVYTHNNYAAVKLFGKTILSLQFDNGEVSEVNVHSGSFYDGKGRPSRTTRERLNGLLDLLGQYGVIPEGVRTFLGENGHCCVGIDKSVKTLDASSPVVIIKAHPTNLALS